ncbi:fibroblast growth factor receptor-like 1 [Anopheles arabiensis]|uniref:fibroblast growth factor receptor-like 1 n=1 Tax=Anopheles arabiensis TaxID=7173 RepID=UPI001AAC8DF6|nr:fibroblast growth factor receptor-like 1 [Anopheles arabiensis]XP_040155791.1 fibroblast growth factor receptor-like 1 [Anopheles arabiensis]XP_040155792.1 fibroblast growth factor receptor-like 1 [Anopheles arabiensis]
MSGMPKYAKLHPSAVFFVLQLTCMLPCSPFAIESRSSSDTEIPKLQQCSTGADTQLKCGIKEQHADHMNSSDVRWYFKSCGGGFQQTACSNRALLDALDWQPLDCDNKPCRVTLTIQNASETDAGLYRCTIHPYRTDNRTQLDIQLVRTFELVVTKWPLDESIPAPELLDNLPANTTALAEAQIVLQCRVHSKVPPTIKWFRRINKRLGEHNFNQNKSIRYLENFYELLPSAGEKLLSHDVYLSKLILYNASERDIGIYVCVGINYVGVSMADAYVNLLNPNGTPVEEGAAGAYVELMVLFLIPVALALIPLLGWIVLNLLRAKHQAEEKSLVQLHDSLVYEPNVHGGSAVQRIQQGRNVVRLKNTEHFYEKVDIV